MVYMYPRYVYTYTMCISITRKLKNKIFSSNICSKQYSRISIKKIIFANDLSS